MIQRADFDDAGVVDENVNLIEMIDDFPHSSLNLIAIEQIAFDCENSSVAPSDISLGAGEFFCITREESNLPTLIANVARQHEPKSTRSATDQSNFIAQRVLRRAKDARRYPTAN
jgi:hypothetical protein